LYLKISVKQGTVIAYLATRETRYNSMVYLIYGEKLTSSLKNKFSNVIRDAVSTTHFHRAAIRNTQ